MNMLKKTLRLSVSAFLLCAGNSYAFSPDISPARHTTFTTELESTDSYQIARTVFLPDTADDLGMSGRSFKSGYYTSDDKCSDYTLNSCPERWVCSECKTTDLKTKYKKSGCQNGYVATTNKGEQDCICPPEVSITGNQNLICTKKCDGKCVATECIPLSNTEQNCTRGKTECDDGCGGKRQCCNPCLDTYIGALPANAHYIKQGCIDDEGINDIKSGWTCDEGYKKTAAGDSCIKDIPKTECSAGQVDLDTYWCDGALKCWWK